MSINEEPTDEGGDDSTANDGRATAVNGETAASTTTTATPTVTTPTNPKKKKKSKIIKKKMPVSSTLLLGSVMIHGLVWLLVGIFLFVINLVTTLLVPPWFLFPVLGWGIGLGLHIAVACGVVVSLGREQDLTVMTSVISNILAPVLPLLQQGMSGLAFLLTNLINALVDKVNNSNKDDDNNNDKEE
jgi:ABC-type multidrug transport system permease subunit